MYQLHRVNRQLIDANWQRIKNSGGPFLKGPAASYGQFESFLSQAAFAVELDYGLLTFDRTHDKEVLRVHGFFWSPKVFRYTSELSQVAHCVCHIGNYRRLEITFPMQIRGIHAIVKGAGFTYEGCLRSYFKWSNEVYDAAMYSFIVEE